MESKQREYDIILLGATGYTGEITAEYLAANAKDKEKWAIAGRNLEKLKALHNRLVAINSACQNVGMIQCDATKPEEVKAVVSRGKVIINFVGPYQIYGEAVVAACVEAKSDYIDVTGEPPFVNRMFGKYDDQAKQNNIWIMPACGVGSLIPDICVELMKEDFEKSGNKAFSLRGYTKYNGRYAKTFSNGTWGTFVNSLSRSGKKSDTPRTEKKPEAPKPTGKRAKKLGSHYYSALSNWAVPFVEGADLHVVRRTNELTLNNAGSPEFSYAQYILLPLIPPLWLIWSMIVLAFVMTFARFPFFKKMMMDSKTSDAGPNATQRATSSFDFILHGEDASKNKKYLKMHCPGPYDTTAISCAQAALTLINERDKCTRPGVTTPGASMLQPVLRRLLAPSNKITVEQKN